jgi:hypothetical protein
VLGTRSKERIFSQLLSVSCCPGSSRDYEKVSSGKGVRIRGLYELGNPCIVLIFCWDLEFFENLMKALHTKKMLMQFHFTPIRMTTIKNTINVGKDVGKRSPHTLLAGM